MKKTRNTVVAHNDFSGWGISYEGDYVAPPPSTTPVTPGGLEVVRSGNRATLRWNYSQIDAHDSFYIEKRVAGGSWERLAFRPPNDPMWTFDAPTNPSWVPFDPLRYDTAGLQSGVTYEFRLRANNGETFSSWSNTATG